ncbi:M1 family metallopeptidase [Erythrobacter sp. SD-21]|uniref:M1 family metallopeptidase n=1 Tax=Erythrobacter sp. SD-21 TaxID=161528 RepID=UPI000153F288|nr:M1 family metallopeptidase [Erythrobacter sp. SD-21]EDL49289.1 peptidase M1, membrane alanine aminopeptidase [Erythrobacter sp. SD-21]
MRRITASLAILLATAACTTATSEPVVSTAIPEPMVSPILSGPEALDTLTYAEPQKARVTHVALDLGLDFAAQRVGGSATLSLLVQPGEETLVLDSNGLQIASITDASGRALPYEIGENVEKGGKGAPLTVALNGARTIRIDYTAPADAAALQWLTPEQTSGKVHPFLFSQGQAILNRTWIPTQDSPGIRQTWEARITAPKPLDVVMSGVRQGEPEDLGDGRRAFRFMMDKPVPPYLIALAAGDIDFKAIGPRTGVWAEPSVLPRAYAEVADTEEMVEAAEELYGEYRWGRYDMIVLPPAFPYGGMENPVMTFLTPTFIAGDRSNNGLVAHELAHSWSGNLVTNAVWGDSWLNEGVTTYFENRIVEAVYGKKRAEQEAALMYANIVETLGEVGEDAPGTALSTEGEYELGSAIAYDKGAFFLRTVERIVGRERFDAWLQQWFDNHAFQPATSELFLEDMMENLVASEAEAERLALREWIFEPGLPANVAKPDPAAFAEVDAAVDRYADRGMMPSAWSSWTAAEQIRFLDNLPAELSHDQLAALDSALGLSATGNNEILFLWLEMALENRYDPAVPQAEQFLATVGRAKFVRPLFGVLWNEGDWGRPIATRIYAKTRDSYHSVTRAGVDRVMSASD